MTTTETLRCSDCEHYLPLGHFSKSVALKRGYQYRCRDCKKPHQRIQNLKNKYGLTVDAFEELWESVSGRCQICSDVLLRYDGKTVHYAVDHNHATGDIRGLLCPPCNKGLGHLKDSPAILTRAIKYLHDNGYYGPKEA